MAGRTFLKLAGLVLLFQLSHLKLALLHLLLCLCQALLGPLHGLLLRFPSFAYASHLLLEGVNALAEQLSAPSRLPFQASFRSQHERFGLRARDGISWVMGHRQPQPSI